VGSLVLGVAGLAVLLLVSRLSQVPVIQAGHVDATMNWAFVRVDGLASRQPSYDPQTRSLRLWIDDGTGEIMVTAYTSEAEALLASGSVPAMGDRVRVQGTLRIKEDYAYLILNAPQHLQVQSPAAVDLSIADVSMDRAYQRVTVRGMVRGDRIPYEGLRVLTLRDASGEIDVAFPVGSLLAGENLPAAILGRSVQVTGAVDQYRGQAQISLGRARDLLILEQDIVLADPRPIDQIASQDVGRIASVTGVVGQVTAFSAGARLQVDDGTGTLTVLLWQDVLGQLADKEALTVGTTVRAVGEIAEYRGVLEIVPQIPSDLEVLTLAEPVRRPCQLAELSAESIGQWVRIEGLLRSIQPFAAGMRGTLDDGTGTMALVLWRELYDALPARELLTPGAILSVEGQVSTYRGALEVIPGTAADLRIVGQVDLSGEGSIGVDPQPVETPALPTNLIPEPSPTWPATAVPEATARPESTVRPQPTVRLLLTATPRPQAEIRRIGQIGWEDIGRVFSLQKATITEVWWTSGGASCRLSDGDSTIILFMFQDDYETLSAKLRHNLVPGSVVRVQGTVAEWSGELEIIPRSEGDIEVLASGQNYPLEQREIGRITPADEGRCFSVEGKIVAVQPFSKGTKLLLEDGTGQIAILLWQNIYDRVAERERIAPGIRLRATGPFGIWVEGANEFQIVPRAARDVVLP
jgi:DNA/RNA endonuclease YhcR with UshA esterase domain